MAIGLLDQDLLLRPGHFCPNLEIMKLSTYYKNQKEIVRLILDARTTDQYREVIIRKDKIDNSYPDTLFGKQNISFGGLAFTNNKYKPMPDEMENSLPDITIYDKFLVDKKIGRAGMNYLKGSHFRLSTDNINCNVDYLKYLNKGHAVIHDKNIFHLKDSYENLYDISQSYKILTKYPLRVDKNEAEKWITNLNFITNSLVFIITGKMTNYEFKKLVNTSYLFDFEFGVLPVRNEYALVEHIEEIIKRILYLKANNFHNHFKYNHEDNMQYPEYTKFFFTIEKWSMKGAVPLSSVISKNKAEDFSNLFKKYPQLKPLIYADPLLIRQKGGIII